MMMHIGSMVSIVMTAIDLLLGALKLVTNPVMDHLSLVIAQMMLNVMMCVATLILLMSPLKFLMNLTMMCSLLVNGHVMWNVMVCLLLVDAQVILIVTLIVMDLVNVIRFHRH